DLGRGGLARDLLSPGDRGRVGGGLHAPLDVEEEAAFRRQPYEADEEGQQQRNHNQDLARRMLSPLAFHDVLTECPSRASPRRGTPEPGVNRAATAPLGGAL